MLQLAEEEVPMEGPAQRKGEAAEEVVEVEELRMKASERLEEEQVWEHLEAAEELVEVDQMSNLVC